MAYAEFHPLLDGITGLSGGLVFRRVGEKTIISQRPAKRGSRSSPAQAAQRARFSLARAYARQVLADPWQRRAYETLAKQRSRRVDLLVLSDYLTPPVVTLLDVSDYQRQVGATLRVLAQDDVEVVAVEVTLQTTAGVVLERGAARPVHGVWCYCTTTACPPGQTMVVTAVARDRPGHDGRLTVALP